jgi:hypothetical protein
MFFVENRKSPVANFIVIRSHTRGFIDDSALESYAVLQHLPPLTQGQNADDRSNDRVGSNAQFNFGFRLKRSEDRYERLDRSCIARPVETPLM